VRNKTNENNCPCRSQPLAWMIGSRPKLPRTPFVTSDGRLSGQACAVLSFPIAFFGAQRCKVVRVTRWILAILCGFYSLINVVGLVVTYGAKGGWLPLPSNMPQLAPLVEAVSWWQAPIWLAVIILYLVVALRLIRGRSAFRVYMLAFVVDLVRWLPSASDSYAFKKTARDSIEIGFAESDVHRFSELLLAAEIALNRLGVSLLWTTLSRPIEADILIT
jgi:hypothetical protein